MRSTERRRQFYKSFEAQALRSRSLLTQLSDDLTSFFGSTLVLVLHVFWFAAWILINTGAVQGITPFDPFPFGLLTMVVSLEAIFLAVFILVSQNRQSYIASLREEVHMRVNLIAEEETTKVLEVLTFMMKNMKMDKNDPELKAMLEKLDTYNLERSIIEQIERANKSLAAKLKDDFKDILIYPVTKPLEVIKEISINEEAAIAKATADK